MKINSTQCRPQIGHSYHFKVKEKEKNDLELPKDKWADLQLSQKN